LGLRWFCAVLVAVAAGAAGFGLLSRDRVEEARAAHWLAVELRRSEARNRALERANLTLSAGLALQGAGVAVRPEVMPVSWVRVRAKSPTRS
jgi:hypothetical protein